MLYVLLTIIAVGVLLLSEPGQAILSFLIWLGIIAALLFVAVMISVMLYGLAKPYFTKTPTNKVAPQENLNAQWEQSKPVVPSSTKGRFVFEDEETPAPQSKPVVPPEALRLKDNHNGTVTDTEIFLMWEQNDSGRMDWNSANILCERIIVAGYTDWRLPNKDELLTLIDKTQKRDSASKIQILGNEGEVVLERGIPSGLPLINMTMFPNAQPKRYWTSVPHPDDEYAWYVDFYDGYVSYDKRSDQYYVRCVR